MPITVDGKIIRDAALIKVVEDGFIGISGNEERLEFDGSGGNIKLEGADLEIRNANSLILSDADNTHSVSIKPNTTTTSSFSLVFPNAQGTANQVLKNDGSGNLSWVNHQATSSSDSPTFTNLTVTGSLDVLGATTQLDTTSSIVKDKTLALGVPGGMVEASCVTVNATSTTTITSNGHSISDGQSVYIDADADGSVPTGVYVATYVNANTFTIPTTSASASARTIYHSIDDSTDATANGSGIVIPAASELKSITYSSTNDKFITSESFEASSFIKTSGTASQFLKADGTVDNNTYLTAETNDLSSVTGTLAIGNGGTGATTAAGVRTNIGLDTTDNVQFAKLGLGVATTTKLFHVDTGEGELTFHNDAYGSNANLRIWRNDTSIASGNPIGYLSFAGSDASAAPTDHATIYADAAGTHASGDNPTNLKFQTTDSGSEALADRMTILHDGNVGIGTTTPGAVIPTDSDTTNLLEIQSRATNKDSGLRIVRYGDDVVGFDLWVDGGASTHDTYFDNRYELSDFIFRSGTNVTNDKDEVMRVTGEGNVGIGTDSPTDKLEVHGTNGELFSVSDTLTGTIFSVNDISGLPVIEAFDSGNVILGEYAGNVGIGTASIESWAKLDVDGNINADYIRVSGLSSSGEGMGFQNAADDDTFYLTNTGASGASTLRLGDGLWVEEGGKVGIGAPTPEARLDIQDGNIALVTGADNGATTLTDATIKTSRMGVHHYTNAEEPTTLFVVDSESTTSSIYIGGGTSYMNATSFIKFFTATNGTTLAGTQQMVIDKDGHVGIGDETPENLLSVRGESPILSINGISNTDAKLRLMDGDTMRWDVYNDESDGDKLFISDDVLTRRFLIQQDGNVGIGTASAQQKLEVRGGVTTEADSYTKLLIHSDDTSNTTVFTDYSPSSHVLTRNNVAHSSTQKKFGSTSIYFDGTDDWIEVADSTDWNFGAPSGNTNDFTIDFWWKDDGSADADGIISIGHDSTYTTNEAILVYKNGSNLELYSSTGVASGGDVINGAQMGAYGSDWNHYAIVRSGTSWACYQNGIQISVNTNITAEPRSDVNTFYVGRRVSSTGTCATGYLDELRISKGIARWTSAFTPPNRPYSTINDEFVADLDNLNTTLTVNDGSVGIGDSTPATELDVNGVITATGGNSTNWNTAHGWGDHSGAGYLTSETNNLSSVTNTLAIANGGTGATTASDALTNLGLGSTSTPSFGDSLTLTSASTSNAANPSLTLFRDSSSPADDDTMGRIIFSGNDAAGNLTYYSQLIAESESVTSSGERGALWSYSTLNGTYVKSTNLAWVTASVNGIEFVNGDQLFGIGINASGQLGFYADGSDSARVLLLDDEDGQPIFTFTEENGTAILEGGETSITAHKPLISTSDSYTKLLIHSDTADNSIIFIDSSPSGHTVTANSASHQDVQKKFGGTSILFDGTDDYLSLPDSADFDVGAGDYTFDCWYYPTSVDTVDGIFEFGNISATTQSMVGFGLFADLDSYGLRVHHGTGASSNYLDTNETLTANQWYHIAVTRSSGTVKIFVDGVEKASQTMNQSIGQGTNSAYIGRAVHTTHYVDGYLDEVRFSNGIARWDSSFIPPSRPYSTVNDEFFADIEKGVVVTDNNDDANYDVTFTNGVNGLLEDNGEFYYNPNTGTLRVPNLTVNGTTTTVDTVEMQAANAIVFEGATPDAYETTLTITDPTTVDKTITLPDATGTVVTTGNLTDITTVGTIATGTWQGTAIADAYISSQATWHGKIDTGGTGLTKSGTTLNVDASQTQITEVGTITTGTWEGSLIANAYFEDATTFVDTGGTGLTKTGSTLDVDASQTQITGLGTITTGTWAASVIDKAYLATDISSLGTVTACTGLDIQGALTATTKSFNIEHPTKEGKRLVYGSLEGEEHGVYTRGRLSGEDIIDLPDHWTGLVDEDSMTVQLTAVGSRQDLWVEKIYDNKIKIGSSKMPIACFYLVHAERKDVDKLKVEVDA